MARIALFLLVLASLFWVEQSPANAAKRVALVVGNSTYEHVTALPNPKNDAREMAAKLEELGFDVRLLNDATNNDLRDALAELSSVAVGAEIGAVFFAGHGIEVDRQNYLIPVDARLETDLHVRFEATPLDDVMAALEGVTGVRLVMLDACRNNPFISSMKVKTANRSLSRGLSRVEPSVGTLVSFAAKEGTTAADGDAQHSPYTSALLAAIDQPGLEINRMFRLVRDQVLATTEGKQEPYTYGSTSSAEIFLREPVRELKEPPQDVISATPPVSPADVVLTDFQLAEKYGTEEAWEAFLAKHGETRDNFYVDLARVALEKLQTSAKEKTADSPPPAPAEGKAAAKEKSVAPKKPKAVQSKPKNSTKTGATEPKTKKAAVKQSAAPSASSPAESSAAKKKSRPSAHVAVNSAKRIGHQKFKSQYGTIVCQGRAIGCRYLD
jgi:hypothetical protein